MTDSASPAASTSTRASSGSSLSASRARIRSHERRCRAARYDGNSASETADEAVPGRRGVQLAELAEEGGPRRPAAEHVVVVVAHLDQERGQRLVARDGRRRTDRWSAPSAARRPPVDAWTTGSGTTRASTRWTCSPAGCASMASTALRAGRLLRTPPSTRNGRLDRPVHGEGGRVARLEEARRDGAGLEGAGERRRRAAGPGHPGGRLGLGSEVEVLVGEAELDRVVDALEHRGPVGDRLDLAAQVGGGQPDVEGRVEDAARRVRCRPPSRAPAGGWAGSRSRRAAATGPRPSGAGAAAGRSHRCRSRGPAGRRGWPRRWPGRRRGRRR